MWYLKCIDTVRDQEFILVLYEIEEANDFAALHSAERKPYPFGGFLVPFVNRRGNLSYVISKCAKSILPNNEFYGMDDF